MSQIVPTSLLARSFHRLLAPQEHAAAQTEIKPPIPWRGLALGFLASRIAVWIVAAISHYTMPKGQFYYPPGNPLDWLMQWDARWFVGVAREGYEFDPSRMSSVNFLPLYPMCVRAMSALVPNLDVAAYLVTYLFCFGAAVLLWRLVRDATTGDTTANASVAFFLLGPVTVFYSSAYSEAAFLFWVLATFVAARRGRWWLAGACGIAAALSRSVGVLLVLPLAVEFLQRHRDSTAWRSPRTWLRFASCAMPVLGTIGYVAFLWWKFGDPNAYVISQTHGGHDRGWPWTIFSTPHFHHLLPFYKLWFGGTAIAGVILTVAVPLLRLPLSFSVFSIAMSVLYLSINNLEGIPRFFSIVFPFYAVLGIVRARWRWTGTVLLAVSGALMAMSVALFANGYWFT